MFYTVKSYKKDVAGNKPQTLAPTPIFLNHINTYKT